MCGIVGYIGERHPQEVLVDSLKKLEYRGYDSAGIAVFDGKRIGIKRCKGKLKDLEACLSGCHFRGNVGIGHTRWATHGRPSEANAHPHRAGAIVVVHNGIIENYLTLKDMLRKEGHHFRSETDSEVISHLIDKFIKQGKGFEDSVRKAVAKMEGSYALAILNIHEPHKMIAVRKESPLVIGIGEDENFVASDVPALLKYTRRIVFMEDNEMAVVEKNKVRLTSVNGKTIQRKPHKVTWDPILAEKGGYKHFMLKEIHEQPRAITDTFRGRVSEDQGKVFLGDTNLTREDLKKIKKIFIVACGTAWHAGLVGKLMIEKLTRIPVETDLGSEFRYREPIVNRDDLLILISQSGETADTLAALKEGRKRKAKTLAICNVVGSTVSREAGGMIYTHAGPEIGVASTKAFTCQITALYLFTLQLARARGKLTASEAKRLVLDLVKIPHQVEELLNAEKEIAGIAKKYGKCRGFLYLARGIQYPIALEGALKLKEISYTHAEGYAAGEMKHGPIALIDETIATLVLLDNGITFDKVLSNMEEVKARDGKIIAVSPCSDRKQEEKADDVILIPCNNPFLNPILSVIPLQLFAYHVALLKGTDIDQPRNLAKSVTVE
jgi:glucosamine--fructose-6-phosphate aminotransferase (isomerizing)